MEKSITIGFAGLAALAIGGVFTAEMAMPERAEASPAPYVTGPNDVPNVMVNNAISNINNAAADLSTECLTSGNTTGTCNAPRFQDSVTNLTTSAGGNVSALVTVADSLAVTASDVTCHVQNYGGAGQPTVGNVSSSAGNVTFVVQNSTVSGGAALNATVPVYCKVQN